MLLCDDGAKTLAIRFVFVKGIANFFAMLFLTIRAERLSLDVARAGRLSERRSS